MTCQQAPMPARANQHRPPYVATGQSPRWRQSSSALAGVLSAARITCLLSALVVLGPPAAHAQCAGNDPNGPSFSGKNVDKPGDKTNLRWTYPDAVSCTVRSLSEDHLSEGFKGEWNPPVRVDTTFELTCLGQTGPLVPSCYTPVRVGQPLVKIDKLVAEPNTIVNDGAATATLKVTVTGEEGGATACKAQAIGSADVENFVGCPDTRTSFCLSKTPHYDTTYRVTCKGSGTDNTDARDVQVRVVGPVGIAKFTADPPTVADGAATRLEWNALNAKACRLDPGAVDVVTATGVAHPAPKQYTAYRLTCEGWDIPATTVQAEVGVAVAP